MSEPTTSIAKDSYSVTFWRGAPDSPELISFEGAFAGFLRYSPNLFLLKVSYLLPTRRAVEIDVFITKNTETDVTPTALRGSKIQVVGVLSSWTPAEPGEEPPASAVVEPCIDALQVKLLQ